MLWPKRGHRRSRERFGDYHVTRLVHSGEKSFVFEAAKVTPEEPVAIKLYTWSYDRAAAELEGKYGLQSEAEVGMELNPLRAQDADDCPIVATLGKGREYGKRRGTRYIVQEFVRGVGLGHLIACRDPSLKDRTQRLAIRMCRALQAVHRKGYVFRDFCSDNLIVQKGGVLRLIDLGFVAPPGIAFEERSGTPSYMSPEQIQGKPLGFETDIYSLGVVVYELLTGELPYVSRIAGSDEQSVRRRGRDVMQMHLREPVPQLPQELHSGAAALCEALPRCLAKDPEERFRSVEELMAALR